jgi:Glycosyl hydrolase family 20, catalytic domain
MTPDPSCDTRPRAAHLDLKGLPPADDRLIELLDVFKLAGYNAVLVEWEDAFPWTIDERFRSPTAYPPDTVRRFADRAEQLDLELIPLVQCLGHMETPLNLPEYAHLREVPDCCCDLNPLAKGARQLVQGMVDDVLKLMPGVKHFHLGGDESWAFATHPDTRAYAEQHGKDRLYFQHVEPLLDNLISKNIRPLLWHDMMIDWDDATLREIGAKANLVAWGYQGHPDEADHHYNTRYIGRFHQLGLPLWAAGAFKGAESMSSDLPDLNERRLNAEAWMELDQRFGFAGLIATGWSRWATHSVQTEPIDGALDALILVGQVFQNSDGNYDPDQRLRQIGEHDRWQRCSTALKLLTDARRKAWSDIQVFKENDTVEGMAPARCGSRIRSILQDWIDKDLAQLDTAAEAVRASLRGLVADHWIDEYLGARLKPLKDECKRVQP